MQSAALGLAAGATFRSDIIAAQPPSFRLVASPGETRFSPDQAKPTRVLHYNQSVPGPVIRIPQGQESIIQFENALDAPGSVHWHGLRIENAMDGVPGMTQPPVAPGDRFEYRLNPPDAGSYWYHTHHRSWEQMAMGLAGVLIVEEPNPPKVDQDLVIAVDDWRLDEDRQIDRDSFGSMRDWSHAGRLGNFLTVNGQTDPEFPVARGERVRLRLVNIANARVMNLLLHEAEMSVIAVDGQPVEPIRLEQGRIRLAPGQRTDVMVDMLGKPGDRSLIEVVIGEYAYEVGSFVYADKPRRQLPLEDSIRLPPNPLHALPLPERYQSVPLVMQGGAMGSMRSAEFKGQDMEIRELVREHRQAWAINGVAGLPEAPLFRVKRGSAISLDIVNDNRWPHAMHVHGHHFIDSRRPGIWRDTALFSSGEEASLRFVADNPGKWLIHCHMVEHMAGGMNTWFEVT